MAYRNTPPEQTFPSRATHKRKAADRRIAEAARLYEEADDLDRRWQAFEARRRLAKRLGVDMADLDDVLDEAQAAS